MTRLTRPRNLVIAALAAAMLIVGALPALAASKNASVLTDDPAPGGKAIFTDEGFDYLLRACDLQKDGHGVEAYASFHKWGFQNRVADLNGKGGCARRTIHISGPNLDRPVYVTVCLHKSGNRYCDYNVGRS